MNLWLILVQEADGFTWLEAAWDDESTAENHSGWQEEVDRVRKLAYENKYEMRIVQVSVPGLYEAFDIPKVKGEIV